MKKPKKSMKDYPLNKDQKRAMLLATQTLLADDPNYLNYALSITFTKTRNRVRDAFEIDRIMQSLYSVMCEEFVRKRRYAETPKLCPRLLVFHEEETKGKTPTDPHVHCLLVAHKDTVKKVLPYLKDNSFKTIGRFPKRHPSTIRTSQMTDCYDLENWVRYCTKSDDYQVSVFGLMTD